MIKVSRGPSLFLVRCTYKICVFDGALCTVNTLERERAKGHVSGLSCATSLV
jgi:hypothetical protein